MYMTYKFTHFTEVKRNDKIVLFENDLSEVIEDPRYLTISYAR